MGNDPEGGRSYGLAEKMAEMIKNDELLLFSISDEAFEAITNESPELKGCETMFFLQATRKGEPHQIVMRAHPSSPDLNFVFREILERVKGLPHEGTHLMQATGKDESILHGDKPFDFGS